MKIPNPIFPKEHGAWAVLFIPLICGVSYAKQFSMDSIFIVLASLSFFLAYVPMQYLLKSIIKKSLTREKIFQSAFWATIYASAGIIFFLPIILKGNVEIAFIGIIAAVFFALNFLWTMHHPKTIVGDLLAVAGLTLSAPLGYYAAGKTLYSTAILLWCIHFLYFSGAVFYVHMKISAVSLKKNECNLAEKISVGKYTIAYVIFSAILLAVLFSYTIISVGVLVAFVPLYVHCIYGTFMLSSEVHFKKVGFALLFHSVFYAIIVGFFSMS